MTKGPDARWSTMTNTDARRAAAASTAAAQAARAVLDGATRTTCRRKASTTCSRKAGTTCSRKAGTKCRTTTEIRFRIVLPTEVQLNALLPDGGAVRAGPGMTSRTCLVGHRDASFSATSPAIRELKDL